MPVIRTRGDALFLLLLSVALIVLGVVLLLSPARPLPTDLDAYIPTSGRLDAVVSRDFGRGRSVVRFRLLSGATVYESREPGIDRRSADWQARQTYLAFHRLDRAVAEALAERADMAYGLHVDGLATSTLDADIARVNARLVRWPGALALTLGLAGLLVAHRFLRRAAGRSTAD